MIVCRMSRSKYIKKTCKEGIDSKRLRYLPEGRKSSEPRRNRHGRQWLRQWGDGRCHRYHTSSDHPRKSATTFFFFNLISLSLSSLWVSVSLAPCSSLWFFSVGFTSLWACDLVLNIWMQGSGSCGMALYVFF